MKRAIAARINALVRGRTPGEALQIVARELAVKPKDAQALIDLAYRKKLRRQAGLQGE